MDNNMDRRKFLGATIAGAGALLTLGDSGRRRLFAGSGGALKASDRVELPGTGLVTSRMAIGSGTHGWAGESDQTRMGMDSFVALARHAYERGITFWDAADMYGSHRFFRRALQEVPREDLVILSKSTSAEGPGMAADIERFRGELGTDVIDILLLHCMTSADWNIKRKAAMDAVSEAKEKGVVRTCGVSCHDLGALKTAAESPWVEVILARINHDGESMDDTPDKVIPVLRRARANGKTVLGMKIAAVGKLAHQIDQSLQFVLGKDLVDAFTMGFGSTEELDQVMDKVAAVEV